MSQMPPPPEEYGQPSDPQPTEPPRPTPAPNAAAGPPPQVYYIQQPKSGGLGKVILILLLLASAGLNVLLFMVLVSGAGGGPAMTVDGRQRLQETVIRAAAYDETDAKVAVINIKGIITEEPMDGAFGPDGTYYDLVRRQVAQVLRDKDVEAVVLRVNSPGGGATASDMMYRDLASLGDAEGRKVPVVVHMGSVAASGGYYVSMAGDHIMAQPTCVTGSIGVIAVIMNMEGLLEEKLGIVPNTFTSGPYKDVPSAFRAMSDDEEQYFRETVVMPIYERFVSVVEQGRPNLSRGRVRGLADGRVFTAELALEHGLIDSIGTFDEAIEKARGLAGLSDARVVEYRRQVDLFEMLGLRAVANAPQVRITPETVSAWQTPRIMMLWM